MPLANRPVAHGAQPGPSAASTPTVPATHSQVPVSGKNAVPSLHDSQNPDAPWDAKWYVEPAGQVGNSAGGGAPELEPAVNRTAFPASYAILTPAGPGRPVSAPTPKMSYASPTFWISENSASRSPPPKDVASTSGPSPLASRASS